MGRPFIEDNRDLENASLHPHFSSLRDGVLMRTPFNFNMNTIPSFLISSSYITS